MAIRSRREDTRCIVHSQSGTPILRYPTDGAPRSQDSLKIQCNRSTVVLEAAHWVVKMKRSPDLQGFLAGSSYPSDTQRITKWTRCRPPRSEALLWDRKVIARSVGPGAVRVTRGLRSSGDAAQGLAPDAMAVPQGTKTTLQTPFYSRGRDGCLFSLYRRRSWTAPARLWVQDCMATPKLSTLTRRTLSFQRWLRSCRFAEMPGLTRMSE